MASLEADTPPLQAINHSYGDKQRSLATLFPEKKRQEIVVEGVSLINNPISLAILMSTTGIQKLDMTV